MSPAGALLDKGTKHDGLKRLLRLELGVVVFAAVQALFPISLSSNLGQMSPDLIPLRCNYFNEFPQKHGGGQPWQLISCQHVERKPFVRMACYCQTSYMMNS